MRTFRDAKSMAKALRQGLQERGIELTHSDCLELVARQFGLQDWNTLSSRINGQAEFGAVLKLPKGWIASGSAPDLYEMGIDPSLPRTPAVIRSKFAADDSALRSAGKGFGTMMQSVLADPFRGKRLRLKAELKSEDVDGAGTIWMRIDRAPGETLRFDNMEQRSKNGVLKGTADWIPREVVLDVPQDASSIHFGFYLRGRGKMWARLFDLAEVGEIVAATSSWQTFLDRPTNLDFKDSEPQ
jgi:hypothetical protein